MFVTFVTFDDRAPPRPRPRARRTDATLGKTLPPSSINGMAAPPLRTWRPPGCMATSSIFFVGFSELARYATWFNEHLRCRPECRPICLPPWEHLSIAAPLGIAGCPDVNISIGRIMERCHYSGQREVFEILAKRRFGLPERRVHGGGDPEFFELRDGLCREDRFGVAGGVQSACRDAEGGTSVDINYRWKTFQRDRFDVDDIDRVREAATKVGFLSLFLSRGVAIDGTAWQGARARSARRRQR